MEAAREWWRVGWRSPLAVLGWVLAAVFALAFCSTFVEGGVDESIRLGTLADWVTLLLTLWAILFAAGQLRTARQALNADIAARSAETAAQAKLRLDQQQRIASRVVIDWRNWLRWTERGETGRLAELRVSLQQGHTDPIYDVRARIVVEGITRVDKQIFQRLEPDLEHHDYPLLGDSTTELSADTVEEGCGVTVTYRDLQNELLPIAVEVDFEDWEGRRWTVCQGQPAKLRDA